MPGLHQNLRKIIELEVSSSQLDAFIKRMESVRDGEARLARLLEEDINVSERLFGFLIGVKPRGFCDQCAADALALPLAPSRNMLKDWRTEFDFAVTWAAVHPAEAPSAW